MYASEQEEYDSKKIWISVTSKGEDFEKSSPLRLFYRTPTPKARSSAPASARQSISTMRSLSLGETIKDRPEERTSCKASIRSSGRAS